MYCTSIKVAMVDDDVDLKVAAGNACDSVLQCYTMCCSVLQRVVVATVDGDVGFRVAAGTQVKPKKNNQKNQSKECKSVKRVLYIWKRAYKSEVYIWKETSTLSFHISVSL